MPGNSSPDIHSPHGETASLLLQAGKAALRMEKLNTMELWFGKRGEACAFSYEKANARILLRSTWDMVIRPDVVDVWSKVLDSALNHRVSLRVEHESLSGADILAWGCYVLLGVAGGSHRSPFPAADSEGGEASGLGNLKELAQAMFLAVGASLTWLGWYRKGNITR